MCGLTIHMLANLKKVIENRGPVTKTLNLTKNVKIFMYAREKCPYSRKAWGILKGHVESDNFTIIDAQQNHYLCSKSFKPKPELDNDVLKELLRLWKPIHDQGGTYPDIYVHNHPQWYRVGGCDDLQACITVPHILSNDLLHLLPLVHNTKGTESSSLKF